MRHWILMFRPETYAKVKELGLIGVAGRQHLKRLAEIKAGDKFVAYVSRTRLLDGRGEFTSELFHDETPAFGPGGVYPYRAKVRFELTGAAKDAKDLLWGLQEFQEGAKTIPANTLFCRGGVMTITAADYSWLGSVLDGTWVPEPAS